MYLSHLYDTADKGIFIYGKLENNSFTSPYYSYKLDVEYDTSFNNGFFPVLLQLNKIEIFFKHEIFNSYVLREDEEFYYLFNLENTLMRIERTDLLEYNKLYTFRRVNEKITLYDYSDKEFVGSTHMIKNKKSYPHSTVIFNNQYRSGEEVPCIFFMEKISRKYFIDKNDPFTGEKIFNVIYKNRRQISLKNGHMEGYMKVDEEVDVGDKVRCSAKKRRGGKMELIFINKL